MPKLKRKTRADGRLQSKIHIGDGKYKYVYATTQKELEQKVIDLKIKMGKGIDITADNDSFDYWRTKWLKIKKNAVAAKYYETLEVYAKKLDNIAYYPVTKIRAMDLQDILLDMAVEPSSSGKPYSQRTIKLVRDIAIGILDIAIDNRVIDYNVFGKVKIPKTETIPQKREALTKEQQQWIVDTPHRAQTAAMIMMYAGLRRGELLALQWTDIDLKAKTININKAVEMVKGKAVVKPQGKTDAATRLVYIPDVLVDYLKNIPCTNFLVCPAATGKLMSQSSWRRMWESYLGDLNIKYGDFDSHVPWTEKHGKGKRPTKFSPEEIPMLIPAFTAHWLRHTFITNMYHAGVDILTAKQQAGHSDIKVTLNIYTHLDSEHKIKNIDKLNEYLNREKSDGCQIGVS